jgi:CBS domain-containing protein
MTKDVSVLSPETTVREAMEILSQGHISGAPVVTGQSVVGVVSTGDLLSFASTLRNVPTQRDNTLEADEWVEPDAEDEEEEYDDEDVAGSSAFFSDVWDDGGANVSERMVTIEIPTENSLEEHDVSEMMTRELWTLSSDAHATDAADLMRQHGIHRVLVVDGKKLVGIVSALDIAKAVAEGRFNPTRPHHKA